jgi:hypothetical protein
MHISAEPVQFGYCDRRPLALPAGLGQRGGELSTTVERISALAGLDLGQLGDDGLSSRCRASNLNAPRKTLQDAPAKSSPRAPSRLLKKSAAWGRNRQHNGIQRSPKRTRTAAEMSFSTAC